MNRGGDALASLALWDVEVEVAGVVGLIPAMSAKDWMITLLRDDVPLPIVPGLFDDPVVRNDVLTALAFGQISLDEIQALSRSVLEQVSGLQWWAAHKLIGAAADSWRIVGPLLRLDLEKASFAALCDALLMLCREKMKPEDLTAFELELFRPPPEVDAAELYDAQAMADVLSSLLGPPPTLGP